VTGGFEQSVEEELTMSGNNSLSVGGNVNATNLNLGGTQINGPQTFQTVTVNEAEANRLIPQLRTHASHLAEPDQREVALAGLDEIAKTPRTGDTSRIRTVLLAIYEIFHRAGNFTQPMADVVALAAALGLSLGVVGS
jgi:hypothetical protein